MITRLKIALPRLMTMGCRSDWNNAMTTPDLIICGLVLLASVAWWRVCKSRTETTGDNANE